MKKKKIKQNEGLTKFIQEMEGDEQKVKILPYHDFVNKTLYYGFFYKGKGHIITSKKDCFAYEDAGKMGIELIHKKNTVSKLSQFVLERFSASEKVNCYDCYKDIMRYLKAQIYLTDETDYSILALWVMATYMARVFDKCMYIYINGGMGTGKTTLLESMSNICFNGICASNIKQAALTRSIDADGSTVFIDEKENLYSQDEGDTKLALNIGFNRKATIRKCNKDNEPEDFYVYSLKMIAAINKIPETLIDRSYIIETKKKEGNLKKSSKNEIDDLAKKIVDSLYLIGLTYAEQISEIYENPEDIGIPEFIKDRELDKWQSIFAIAKFIDNEHKSKLVDKLADAATRKHIEQNNEAILRNPEYMLAKALCDYLECSKGIKDNHENVKIYTTDWVHEHFLKDGILEDIFSEYRYKRPSKAMLSRILKKYLGIDSHIHSFRDSSQRCYKLDRNHLNEIIKKYEDKLLK